MLLLKIDNPEIESIFLNKFGSNKEKFIDFIQERLSELEQDKQEEFTFDTQDPRENSYYMAYSQNVDGVADSNPFSEIENVAEFAKSLREKAYR